MSLRRNSGTITFLKIICAAGISISVLISVFVFLLIFNMKHERPVRKVRPSPFTAALEDYDRLYAEPRPAGSGLASAGTMPSSLDIKKLDALLHDLELQAPNIPAHLSVLKRRRIIAKQSGAYLESYRQALKRVLAVYPHSQQLAMAAAEALIMGKIFLSQDEKEDLAGYRAGISQSQEPVFALALNTLAGNLASPQSAGAIPDVERLLISAGAFIDDVEEEELGVDIALLRLLGGNVQGALTLTETLASRASITDNTRRAIAEMAYDFGRPLRAAQFLAPLSDPASIRRQADALYLAGYIDEARTIWTLLCSPGDVPVPASLTEGVLYSLAATDRDPDSGRDHLKSLMLLNPNHSGAAILYARFLDDQAAAAFLSPLVLSKNLDNILLELELLRRRRRAVSPGRFAGEVWLLIGRYPKDARLYEWGIHFFDTQKQFDETEIVLRNAGFAEIESPRIEAHRALNAIIKGHTDEGEAQLMALAGQEDNWCVQANLGVIREARRAPREALPFYETALASLTEAAHLTLNGGSATGGEIPWVSIEAAENQRRNTAKLQIRTARLLISMRRTEDARRLLETAVSLNPDNLQIRMELRQLRERTGY